MKIVIIVLSLFCNTIVYSQNLYTKYEGEKTDTFMKRVFPKIQFTQVLSGNWGDTAAKFKIIGFYPDTIIYHEKAIVLQAVSKNKFQGLKFDHEFGIGVASSSIESVFFLDVDKNGTKELIVIESGTGRCHDELEQYNEETKTIERIPIVVACDVCGYAIFEQKVKSLIVNIKEINQEDYIGNCDYKSLKEYLLKRK